MLLGKKKRDFKEGEQVAFVRVCENQSKNKIS